MKNRNPFAVFFFGIITLGIYTIVWEVKTKNEMNSLGAEIPTAWLIILPIISLYWMWKYCQGVDKVTGGKLSAPLAFVLMFLLGGIAQAILQSEFNGVGSVPATAGPAPVGAAPVTSGDFTTPATTEAPATFSPAPAPEVAPQAPVVPPTTQDVTPPQPPTNPLPPTTPTPPVV